MEKWTIIRVNEVATQANELGGIEFGGSGFVLYLKGSDPALKQSKHEYGPFYTDLELAQFATLHGIMLNGA